mgnify:CR=1 FL=1
MRIKHSCARLSKAHRFAATGLNLAKEEIKNNIELALYKNASIHVIYGNRSFTGDIVKYDTERQRIIMKNFKRQVTSIINLEDIQKITFVPESVKTSQQQEKKTEQHTGNRKNA